MLRRNSMCTNRIVWIINYQSFFHKRKKDTSGKCDTVEWDKNKVYFLVSGLLIGTTFNVTTDETASH